ncbi:hypothetical protein FAZ15_09860 [Sphingobacterium olei]|uniref:Uncharacterized protein n=1 Tax=Sphingobacterium olei TaxID=2571155 RepID=A0A4U0P2E2_9SPHI|nr:hypothetical protein [Sphingobacterium olei]TJZ61486.1 hypothetical protein FAZ15_09860 [Sphingobacterium olei]
MKIIFLIIALFFSVSASAEKVLVANCTEGRGCSFELSDVDVELHNLGDLKVGFDQTLVFGKTKDGKDVQYVIKKPREAIDKDWGGDGFTQIGLFNPHIQPADGQWNAAYGNSTGNDCYGIGNLGAFMKKQQGAGSAGNGDVTFRYPFNPSQLFPSSEMRWIKTGYNTYKGLLDLGSNKISGMKLHYNITIVSSKKIETFYTVEIKIPTKETCKGTIPVTFILIKEKETEVPFSDEEKVEDDLLPVIPKGKEDDLLPVKTKKDDLLPVEPGKKPKTKVDRLDHPKVERIK